MTRALRTEAPRNPKTQGDRIRHARIAAGLSQGALADRIRGAGGSRVSKSLISQWEGDNIKNPTNENLFAIEGATGFSAQWLVSGKGDPKAKQASAARLNQQALKRAIAVAFPGTMADVHAAVVSGLYDVLIDTPDVSDKVLASFAAALARQA